MDEVSLAGGILNIAEDAARRARDAASRSTRRRGWPGACRAARCAGHRLRLAGGTELRVLGMLVEDD